MTVQYADRNASPADYKEFGDDLLITSMFFTLQGEGPFAGVPAVFVRFAGCNLGAKRACKFCDTNFLFDKGKRMSVTQVYNEAVALVPTELMLVRHPIMVITGGEPMLQRGIIPLTQLVDSDFVFGEVQIESNGTLLRDIHPNSVLVVSPKVNPLDMKYAELRPDVFLRANHLKFVVEADPYSPYHKLPEWLTDFAQRRSPFNRLNPVYVSPIAPYKRAVRAGEVASMWTDDLIEREAACANHKHAAKLCLEHGFTLSLQQHLYAELE